MPYPGTRLRAFRIKDELYDAARAKAAEKDEPLSEVVRRKLEEYVAEE